MPRLSADHAVPENVFAAIDKLTLARHVTDFPKMRQTHPTSPSVPRPTTGSSSQWADADGSGLARRAVLVAVKVLSQAIFDASACAKKSHFDAKCAEARAGIPR
ncbi:hypothetical protein EV121DRAFT_297647 [Schizophyllum commune]